MKYIYNSVLCFSLLSSSNYFIFAQRISSRRAKLSECLKHPSLYIFSITIRKHSLSLFHGRNGTERLATAMCKRRTILVVFLSCGTYKNTSAVSHRSVRQIIPTVFLRHHDRCIACYTLFFLALESPTIGSTDNVLALCNLLLKFVRIERAT